jgi:ribonuclease P protein component
MESNYAAKNISTKQPPPREKARLQGENGDQERPGSDQASPGERTQTINSSALLDHSLPKEARLRKRAEFLRVYEHGKRIDGRFITVFVMPGEGNMHRVGITATKRGIGKAHDRNRAKRLLRETFRLSKGELNEIPVKLDWVLNAKRSILKTKLAEPLEDFKKITAKVVRSEDLLATENTRSK